MTTRAGDRGRVEGQTSSRIHVGSLVRKRERWGRAAYTARGRNGALLHSSGWSRAS